MVKYLKLIHNWTGFVISIVMLIVLTTGIYLGGVDFIKRMDDKGQTYQALTAEQKAQISAQLLVKYPQMGSIKLPTASKPYIEVSSRKQAIYLTVDLQEIETVEKGDNAVWRWLFFFHRNFQLDAPGKHANAISAIAATIIMFIGLYLWWLVHKGFKWKHTLPKNTKNSALIKSHIQLGLIFSVPMIIMAVTGAYITYGPRGMAEYNEPVKVIAQAGDVEGQLLAAQKMWPEAELVSVSKPRRAKPEEQRYNLSFNGDNIFALQQTDTMLVDFSSGELIRAQTFSDKGLTYQAKYSARFLHDGARMPTSYLSVLIISSFIGIFMVAFAMTTFIRKEFLRK